MKTALVASEAKIQQLLKVNVNLSDELRIMQKKVARERSGEMERFAQGVWSPSHVGRAGPLRKLGCPQSLPKALPDPALAN